MWKLVYFAALCVCVQTTSIPYYPYEQSDRLKTIKIFYKLFNNEFPNGNEISQGGYNGIHLNYKEQYKILCHGSTKHLEVYWYKNTTQEYLKKGNVNVITAEYPQITENDTFAIVTNRRMKLSGVAIGKLIIDLHETHKIPYENIHLIGHGVGAQIAAIAGETVFIMKDVKVGRITGLDPITAYGYQFIQTKNGILDENDANFVDIIHTENSGYQITGTVDFFPNGGSNQPGCNDTSICSHILATSFFTHSINNNDLVATNCDDIFEFQDGLCKGFPETVMGENVDLKAKGVYQLNTNEGFGTYVYEYSGLLKKKVVYTVEVTV